MDFVEFIFLFLFLVYIYVYVYVVWSCKRFLGSGLAISASPCAEDDHCKRRFARLDMRFRKVADAIAPS